MKFTGFASKGTTNMPKETSKIDPQTALSIEMHSRPGVYAVLLGSGISRAAGIPTGWEVVLDLIKKIARAKRQKCHPDPEAWFTKKYGGEPKYTDLLGQLAKSEDARSALLREYFEPTNARLGQRKEPTKAHRSIAKLASKGYIRVIVTTNFDRLMERALEAEGVSPSVIKSPGAVQGALPLAHSKCTLIKLHGDYMDLQTKNTAAELSKYDERIDVLLDTIFDDYGLVVSGWSAEWDKALQDAFRRRKVRRFTTWWTYIEEPGESASQLITFCQAEMIQISGADEFFEDIENRIAALERFDRPHPLSIQQAVSLTKRYLSESRYRIQLYDLLLAEADQLAKAVTSDEYPVSGDFSNGDYADRIRTFDALSELAIHITATICFWDRGQQHKDTYFAALARVANTPRESRFIQPMLELRRHPARLLLFAAGVAFAARKRYAELYALLDGVKVRFEGEKLALPIILMQDRNAREVFKALFQPKRRKTPVSDHLYTVLRPAFNTLAIHEDDFREAFDLFEIAQSFFLAHEKDWARPGAFMWRNQNYNSYQLPKFIEEVEQEGTESPFLTAGFCGGTLGGFDASKQAVFRMRNSVAGWY